MKMKKGQLRQFGEVVAAVLPESGKNYLEIDGHGVLVGVPDKVEGFHLLVATRSGSRTVVVQRQLSQLAGPYQSEALMYELVGLYNVAHNVYMEWIMIGGVCGLLPPIAFVVMIRRARRHARSIADRRAASLLLVVALVFGIGGLFLSLTYNSFIWLPLALADWLRLQRPAPATGD